MINLYLYSCVCTTNTLIRCHYSFIYRDLRCLRNTIHANLFLTYIMSALLWILTLSLQVCMNSFRFSFFKWIGSEIKFFFSHQHYDGLNFDGNHMGTQLLYFSVRPHCSVKNVVAQYSFKSKVWIIISRLFLQRIFLKTENL